MRDEHRTRRRLLGVSVGIAAFTAVEGLACGNPVEPRSPSPDGEVKPETSSTVDAGVAPVSDATTK